MGLLSLEHGSTAYAVDFVMSGIAVAALAVLLMIAGPRDQRLEILALVLLGLASWTLVEYLLHRFILHGLQPFRAWHAEHHRRPRALIGTPAILSASLILILVFLPMLALGDPWHACAMTLGLVTGYFAYTIAHHATHHWRAGTAWTRQRKRAHALHHSPVGEPGCYGVTSAFWDVVFGTNRTALMSRANRDCRLLPPAQDSVVTAAELDSARVSTTGRRQSKSDGVR